MFILHVFIFTDRDRNIIVIDRQTKVKKSYLVIYVHI